MQLLEERYSLDDVRLITGNSQLYFDFQVYVKVLDLDNYNEYLWDKNRFLNRQVHMQEMYSNFEESGHVPVVDKVGYHGDRH